MRPVRNPTSPYHHNQHRLMIRIPEPLFKSRNIQHPQAIRNKEKIRNRTQTHNYLI